MAPAAAHGLVAAQKLELVIIQIQIVVSGLAGNGAFAAVAADIALAACKVADGQLAVVAAAVALDIAHLLLKGAQLRRGKQCAAAAGLGLLLAVQCRAVSAHQARNIRADHLYAHFFFKGAQHGLVIEGAALHHDLAAQLFRAGGADHLVQCILDHADGQACGDILDAGTVLLCLFD